eukprot:COSAG01_NODE_25048_length_757_cov_1.069909_1_plen_103_part_01
MLRDSRIDSVGDDFYNCQNAIDVVLGRTAGEWFLGTIGSPWVQTARHGHPIANQKGVMRCALRVAPPRQTSKDGVCMDVCAPITVIISADEEAAYFQISMKQN